MTDFFANLNDLRADETELLSTSTKTAAIATRKPAKDEWFRVSNEVHHKPDRFPVYYNKVTNRSYLLTKTVAADPTMRQVASQKIFYVAKTRSGEVFLSMVGTGDDGYSTASRAGHQQAKAEWIRLVADVVNKTYLIITCGLTEDPEFPATPYNELLRMAFGDAGVISDLDHPICRDILGLPPKVA